jgi:hypothetical protein
MKSQVRRWFNFSLRTLFALVTACALATPFIVELVANYLIERAAREHVKAYDSSGGGFRGTDNNLPPASRLQSRHHN